MSLVLSADDLRMRFLLRIGMQMTYFGHFLAINAIFYNRLSERMVPFMCGKVAVDSFSLIYRRLRTFNQINRRWMWCLPTDVCLCVRGWLRYIVSQVLADVVFFADRDADDLAVMNSVQNVCIILCDTCCWKYQLKRMVISFSKRHSATDKCVWLWTPRLFVCQCTGDGYRAINYFLKLYRNGSRSSWKGRTLWNHQNGVELNSKKTKNNKSQKCNTSLLRRGDIRTQRNSSWLKSEERK